MLVPRDTYLGERRDRRQRRQDCTCQSLQLARKCQGARFAVVPSPLLLRGDDIPGKKERERGIRVILTLPDFLFPAESSEHARDYGINKIASAFVPDQRVYTKDVVEEKGGLLRYVRNIGVLSR